MKHKVDSPNRTIQGSQPRKYTLYTPDAQHPSNRLELMGKEGKQCGSPLLTSDLTAYINGLGYEAGFIHEQFPEDPEDLIDLLDLCNPLAINKKEYKLDKAFYEALKLLTGHLFLTWKFPCYRYSSKSLAASQLRRFYVMDFFKEIAVRLNLSQNDLQYFATEEDEFKVGRHLHIIVYLKYPDRDSPDRVLKEILDLLKNSKVVFIPFGHNRHAQIIQNSDKVLRYCLKLKSREQEKPFFHSVGLRRFHHRRLNWLQKASGSC